MFALAGLAVLLAAVAFGAWGLASSAGSRARPVATAAGGTTGAATASPPAPPTTTPQTTTPATTASPTPSPSPSPKGAGAGAAVVDCRARTRAADRVLAVASTGVGHWAEHVQAQVDADAGRITTDQMQAIFARTRLAGPSDVSAYTAAVRTYAHSNGSCRARPGATSGQAHTLAACSQRQHAQAPVLAAAANAMTDWEQHLSDMRRSRMGQVANAQQVWVHTYHAAPPHIRAYQSAAAHFDAPAC